MLIGKTGEMEYILVFCNGDVFTCICICMYIYIFISVARVNELTSREQLMSPECS